MIYLIKCYKNNTCKIGYTENNPLKRLATLQTGNPYQLELIITIEGEQSFKKELHLKLKGE